MSKAIDESFSVPHEVYKIVIDEHPLATYHELQTVYDLYDLYDMLEMLELKAAVRDALTPKSDK